MAKGVTRAGAARSGRTTAAAHEANAANAANAAHGRYGIRARATVLVGGLRGFSDLGRHLDAATTVDVLQEFLVAAADIAVAHRAAIESVDGERFVFLFESGGARRDDCVRAVRTGLAVQRAFLGLCNRWQREERLKGASLALTIGIGTGKLVVSQIENLPGVHTVSFGEPLTRANRLAQGARRAEVLVDEATYSGARRQLGREVVFSSRELPLRARDTLIAYGVRYQRAGLHIVEQRVVTDPVCGRSMASSAAVERRRYAGEVFSFCSSECAERFTGDPTSWL